MAEAAAALQAQITAAVTAALAAQAAPDRRARSPDRRARSPDRRQDGKGRGRKPTPGRRFCNNHRKYGNKTFNCQGNCDFAEN
jgi:hypothetical protein